MTYVAIDLNTMAESARRLVLILMEKCGKRWSCVAWRERKVSLAKVFLALATSQQVNYAFAPMELLSPACFSVISSLVGSIEIISWISGGISHSFKG